MLKSRSASRWRARTVRIYECEACAEEEPTEENVRLTVEPVAPRNAPRPRSFADSPDVDEAERLHPPGFVASRYEVFLRQQGLKEVPPVQLGGYAHGIDGDEALMAMRCRHTPPLLQFSPSALGLALPKVRAAVGVCLKPGCKRPGIDDELAVY